MRPAHAPAALQVVDDGQHGHRRRAHAVEDAEEAELVAHVEVRARLVEQQHARLLGEAAGQGRELALARRRAFPAPAGPAPRCRSTARRA